MYDPQSDPSVPAKTVAAIVLAAGRGTRAGGPCAKQWRSLNQKTVIEHSLYAFHSHPNVHHVILVAPQSHNEYEFAEQILSQSSELKDVEIVTGGSTRQQSVLNGLQALSTEISHVLIHDGARPCVTHCVIDRVLDTLSYTPAAAPAIAITDTLWHGQGGRVTHVQPRENLFRAQTPQGFDREALLQAHLAYEGAATDDAMIMKSLGYHVAIVEGDEDNIKITGPNDHNRAELIQKRQGHPAYNQS